MWRNSLCTRMRTYLSQGSHLILICMRFTCISRNFRDMHPYGDSSHQQFRESKHGCCSSINELMGCPSMWTILRLLLTPLEKEKKNNKKRWIAYIVPFQNMNLHFMCFLLWTWGRVSFPSISLSPPLSCFGFSFYLKICFPDLLVLLLFSFFPIYCIHHYSAAL